MLNSRFTKAALFSSVSVSFIAAFVSPAFAASPPIVTDANTPGQSQDASGDVIVTARKKSENVEKVPLSITALTSRDLQAAGVRDLRDVTLLTPGVTFTSFGANNDSKPIIRGQTDIGGSDINVPVFFDGIFVSNPSAIDFGLVDLARIEVIKGPVSALYGRSAYAGAINYVTAKPTDQVRGELEATGGDYGKYAFNGRISGPIIPGILKGGISASYDHFDGTYHDSVTGQNANGYEKKDVLANLDYTPNEHLEIRPVVYYGRDTFEPAATLIAPANCSVGAGYGYSQSFCGKVPNSSFIGPFISAPGNYGQTGDNRTVFTSNIQASLHYDWGTLTSLTGFDSFLTDSFNEFDDQNFGTATPIYALPAGAAVGQFPSGANLATFGQNPVGSVLTPLHYGAIDKNHDFSEELRYSSPVDLPIRGSLGGYYATSYHYNDVQLARGTCSVPAGDYIVDDFATPCGQARSNQTSSYVENDTIGAVFATIDWDFLDKFTLSTELRNSATKSDYRDLYLIYTPFPTEGYSTSTGSTPNPIGPGTLSKTFWSATSRTTLTYRATPDVFAYVSAANGEKTGGFNNNIAYPTYNPETNWTYEGGIKATLFERRLQVNADVFYIDAANYQISGPPPGATVPGGFITTNYGGLSTPGVEISGLYAVNEFVRLSAGFAYTDPEFKRDAYDFSDVALCAGIASCAPRIRMVGVNPAVSLNGLHPPYESDYTFNSALDVNYPFADGWNAVGRISYRYESKQYYQYPIDTGYFGPRNIVDIEGGVERGPYSLDVLVRNLTNDKTPISVADSAVPGSYNFQAGYFPVAVLPDGRTFEVTLRYKFGG